MSHAKHNAHTTKPGVTSTCWIWTKHCAHWVDVITLVIKNVHIKCKTQWAHHKTWCHFNILDLHETLACWVNVSILVTKTVHCTCQMQTHNGYTTKPGATSTCWICTKHCEHWVDVITLVIKTVHCTRQMQNTMGTPQNMVSFQHAGFAQNIAHTESMSSLRS